MTTMTKIRKPNLEAEAAYESAHMVTHDLLGRIAEMMHDLPAPDGEVHIHWGHVGDVNDVNFRLSQIIEILQG